MGMPMGYGPRNDTESLNTLHKAMPGAKKASNLEDNLGAFDIVLSHDDITLRNHIFPIHVAHGEKYPAEFECEG